MQDIEALVDNSTAAQRAATLDDMIERLSTAGGPVSSDTVTFCYAVIMRLLNNADASERSSMAMQLARSPDLPEELVASLAVSEIAVAAPILAYSTALPERTLVEVARSSGESHMLSITQRGDLSRDVCEALLERGSIDVAMALTNNPASRFTTRSVEMLGEFSADSRELEERLCGRLDLPEAVTHTLMHSVATRLEAQMGAMVEGLEPDALRIALRTSAAEASAEATDRLALSQASIVEVARLASRDELNEAKLAEFIADGCLELAACAFAKLANLKPPIARRVLLATGSETLAVAARAVPLETATYIALAKLVGRDEHMPVDQQEGLIRQYERLPVRTARQVMLFHMKRRQLRATERSEHSRPHDVALAARVAS